MNEILGTFAGYVRTCRTENTPEWMEGLADALNVVADALECPLVFEFDGDSIRGVGVGDE